MAIAAQGNFVAASFPAKTADMAEHFLADTAAAQLLGNNHILKNRRPGTSVGKIVHNQQGKGGDDPFIGYGYMDMIVRICMQSGKYTPGFIQRKNRSIVLTELTVKRKHCR